MKGASSDSGAHVGDVREAEEVGDTTECEHEQFLAPEEAHDLRAERVHDRGEDDLDRRELHEPEACTGHSYLRLSLHAVCTLVCTDLAVDGEADEHEEEEDGEELRRADRHRHKRLRVNNEHETGSCKTFKCNETSVGIYMHSRPLPAPSVTTSSTSEPWLYAMFPRMLNTAKPARTEVAAFTMQMMRELLQTNQEDYLFKISQFLCEVGQQNMFVELN